MTRASARRARATLAALTLLGGPAALAAEAAAAPVVNPSFERSSAASSEFTSQNDPLPVRGWEFWDPQRLIAPVGDPTSGLATVLGVWRPGYAAYPNGLPAGDAVAFLYAAAGAGSGELGLRQRTRTRVAPGIRYSLRVHVGNPRAGAHRGFSVAGFPGYRLELRAGGRLLARDQDRVKPGEGSFVETGVAYTATAADRALGQPLEIRLVNRNAGPGAEVDFDGVRLLTSGASGGGASVGAGSRGSGGVAGVVDSGVNDGGSGGSGGAGFGGGATAPAPTPGGANGGATPPADSGAEQLPSTPAAPVTPPRGSGGGASPPA